MPWKERNRMDLKEEFVLRALNKQTTFTALCNEYGISRRTGYKWLERFSGNGFEGLKDRSRRPLEPTENLGEDVVCKLIHLKSCHMLWGPKKIHALYMRIATMPVSLSSVKRILKKSGLVTKRKLRKQTSPTRISAKYDALAPNDLWTVDFKGYWYAYDQRKCEPLTIRDEYSKYILAAQLLPSSQTEHVKRAFQRVFQLYGLPKVIKSDNGSPFASSSGLRGLTRLSAWWISLGIQLDRIEPGHPGQNGGHERMHRDLKRDIQKQIKGDAKIIQESLDIWREEFNTLRPHEAIGMKCPSDLYAHSEREYRFPEPELEYPLFFISRKINKDGYMKLNQQDVFISTALTGFNVGLKDIDDAFFAVYFNYLQLGLINKETFLFSPLSGQVFDINSVGGGA